METNKNTSKAQDRKRTALAQINKVLKEISAGVFTF